MSLPMAILACLIRPSTRAITYNLVPSFETKGDVSAGLLFPDKNVILAVWTKHWILRLGVVGDGVGVYVGVGVWVGVVVGDTPGVLVGVFVGVLVGVFVGVLVGVLVGVGVRTIWQLIQSPSIYKPYGPEEYVIVFSLSLS